MASGGRYEIKDGKRVKVEGTKPHPAVNKIRSEKVTEPAVGVDKPRPADVKPSGDKS